MYNSIVTFSLGGKAMKKNLLKIMTLVAAIGMLASCEIHFGPSSNSNVISAGLTAGSISKKAKEKVLNL